MKKDSKKKKLAKRNEPYLKKAIVVISIDENDLKQYRERIVEHLACSSSYLYNLFGDKVEVTYGTGHIYIVGNDLFGAHEGNILNVIGQLRTAIKTSSDIQIDIELKQTVTYQHWHYWRSGDKFRLSYTNDPDDNIVDDAAFEEAHSVSDALNRDTVLVPASAVTLMACCGTCNGKIPNEDYCEVEDVLLADPDNQRCKSWWPSEKCLEDNIIKQTGNMEE